MIGHVTIEEAQDDDREQREEDVVQRQRPSLVKALARPSVEEIEPVIDSSKLARTAFVPIVDELALKIVLPELS